jgi:hypothetical protein
MLIPIAIIGAAILTGIVVAWLLRIGAISNPVVGSIAVMAVFVAGLGLYIAWQIKGRRDHKRRLVIPGPNVLCPSCGAQNQLVAGAVVERCSHCEGSLVPLLQQRSRASNTTPIKLSIERESIGSEPNVGRRRHCFAGPATQNERCCFTAVCGCWFSSVSSPGPQVVQRSDGLPSPSGSSWAGARLSPGSLGCSRSKVFIADDAFASSWH